MKGPPESQGHAPSSPLPRSLQPWHYFWIVALAWSALIGILLVTDVREENRNVLELARMEARSVLNRDIAYRRWAAASSGIYVPVTATTPPNPYLANVPERDITTPSGCPLTLMNPAYMTRQVYEMDATSHGGRGHITSLHPLRPGNAPDEWEASVLRTFSRGATECDTTAVLDGRSYLRLMHVLYVEKPCLKCHAAQGYKEGDIRGGISVSLPLEPHLLVVRAHAWSMGVGYGLVWSLGLCGLGLGTRRLQRRMRERDRAERLLRESETRYHSLFEKMVSGFALHEIVCDATGAPIDYVTLEANGEFEKLLQVSREAVLGKRVYEVMPGMDKAWLDLFGKVALTGAPCRYVQYASHIGKWFEGAAFCPKIGQFAVTFVDITERKRAEEVETHHAAEVEEANKMLVASRLAALNIMEDAVEAQRRAEAATAALQQEAAERRRADEALREAERRYRDLFDQANEGLFIMTPDGQLSEVNRAFAEMHGYTLEELKNKTIMDLDVRNERTLSDRDDIVRRMQAGEVVRFEVEHYHKDGHILPLSVTTSMIQLGGQPFYLAFHQDITNRKRAEKALRESEMKYRLLFENASEGILVVDVKTQQLLHANPWICQLLQRTEVELLTRRVQDIFPPEKCSDVLALFGQIAKGEETAASDVPLLRKDGTILYADIHCSITEMAGRQCVAGFFRDATARRLMEEQTAQLMQADKMIALGMLVSGVAHEINNPNHVISANATGLRALLEHALPVLDEQVRQHGDFAVGATTYLALRDSLPRMGENLAGASVRIQRIVEGLRSYARKAPGEMQETVDVNACIHNALQLVSSSVQRYTANLQVRLAESLPAIRGNSQNIEQVCVNLITNACESLTSREKAVRIESRFDAAANRVEIRIEDEGHGISAENQRHLQNPFFTTKRAMGGTGLGLWIVRNILELHGGGMDVDSQSGAGTRVRVWLPCQSKKG